MRLTKTLTGLGIVSSLMALSSKANAGDIFLGPGDSIQEAIDTAVDGDTIHLAAGTYNERIDYSGKAIDIRGASAAGTLISGAGLDGSVVTFSSGEGAQSRLISVCVTAGNGTADLGTRVGGGIYVVDSSPTFLDVIVADNSAEGYGGALYVRDGEPVLELCTFLRNQSGGAGGAIASFYGTTRLLQCNFRDNSAQRGGAVHLESFGLVQDSVFEGNQAEGSGGALELAAYTVEVRNSRFLGNSASIGGGIHAEKNGSLIAGCLFARNSATGQGGGLFSVAFLTLLNCTFAMNSAAQGGGLWASGVAETFTNGIAWNNTPDQLGNATNLNVTYSNVQGGFLGRGNIDAHPQFVDASMDDFRLAAGSPCIDSANNVPVPSDMITDCEGGSRFCDDPNSADTGNSDGSRPMIDMGACEYGHARFTDLGQGLAGQNGIVPVLQGAGADCPSEALDLNLTEARAGSPAILILGFDQLDAPLLDGTLVPSPDFVLTGFVVENDQSLALSGIGPEIPRPLTLFFQFWVVDADGPRGFSASNGLAAEFQ